VWAEIAWETVTFLSVMVIIPFAMWLLWLLLLGREQ